MNNINPFRSSLSRRFREAALRYSSADRSNPHAFKVAMSHLSSGIGQQLVKKDGQFDIISAYDADTFPQTRKVDERWAPLQQWQEQRKLHVTREVNGTQYKNVCRA